MRILYAFLLYLGLALVLGALVTAGLYGLIQYSFLYDAGLGQLSFEKVASRSLLLTLLIGLFVFFRLLNLRSWQSLGYQGTYSTFLRQIARGLSFGIVTMAVVTTSIVLLGVRYWQYDESGIEIVAIIIKALFQGLLIAFIEETLFRGALIQYKPEKKSDRRHSLHLLVVSSALIYATLHFIKSETHIGPDELTWYSGFSYLSGAMYKLSDLSFIGSFLTLIMVGMFLGYLRVRTGSIALGIGVHAGWIMIIQVCSKLTETYRWTELYFLVGNYDRITGYLAASWLLIICLFVLRQKNLQRLAGNVELRH